MAGFRFRLSRVLEWYRTQARLEQNKLTACANAAGEARRLLVQHRERHLALELDLIRHSTYRASEMATLSSWRHRARQEELRLEKALHDNDRALEKQRLVAMEAQRRERLVEKLHDRHEAEHEYASNRAIEELASESHLAAFARNLN